MPVVAKERRPPGWAARIGSARWLLAPAGVVLALAGALLVESARRRTAGEGTPPAAGWVLFGLAAAALVGAAVDKGGLRLAPLAPFRSFIAPQRRAVQVALYAAVLFSAASIPLFLRLNRTAPDRNPGWLANDASWLLYLASLACFALAIASWHRREAGGAPRTREGWPRTLPRRIEVPMLLGLTAAALALRLPALGTIPHGLWFDEAQNGLVAKGLVSDGASHPVFIGDFTQMGSLYFYVLGAVVSVLGSSIWVLRVLPALAGSLTVPLLYLLASRLYGWRTGLAAAGFLAVSAWSITFSRLGLASMVTVALDLAVYLCVVQGLRSGRLAWYGAGGVLLGLDLQGYYVARLVPVVLVLLLAHLTVSGRRSVWALRSGLAAFMAGTVLAFLPVGLFAIQKRDAYQARVSTVSIFSKTRNGGDPHALRKSLRAHLLMFNFRGDGNGRHNLPGSPLLDWLTACLFFSGLGVCLLRIWRWEYFFPAAWFAAALSGGVFSLLFEAPQSHRTLENAVVTALLAGIFLGEVWAVVARAMNRRAVAVAAAAGALAAVGGASAMNVQKYFGRQNGDARVWSDMGTAESDAALLARRETADHEIWLTNLYAGRPVFSFLAPNARPLSWNGPHQLPFAGEGEGGQGVLVLLDPGRAIELATIARMYAHARFEAFRANDGTPLLYAVFVPPRDLAASHGVLALSHKGPRLQRTFSLGPSAGSSRRLVSTLNVPAFGAYRFVWHGPGQASARVVVDGRPAPARLRLTAGLHRVDVRRTGSGGGRLLWAVEGSPFRPIAAALLFDPRRIWPTGLSGLYREGTGFDGPVKLARIDPLIGITFHEPVITPPFTVDWRGEVFAPAGGTYVLGTEQLDTTRLAIDGRLVLTNTQGNSLHEAEVHLARGWHRARLRYQGLTGYFHAYLYWTPPGRPRAVIPSAFLWPARPAGSPSPPLPRLRDSEGLLPPGRLVSVKA